MESLDRKCFTDKLISPFLFKRKISEIGYKMIHNSNRILWILFQFHQKIGKWIIRLICAVESPEKNQLLKYQDISWFKEHIESNYCSIVDWSREVHAPENRNVIFLWKGYWMRKQVFNSSRSSHGIISFTQKAEKQRAMAFTSAPQPWYGDSNKVYLLLHAPLLVLMDEVPWRSLPSTSFLQSERFTFTLVPNSIIANVWRTAKLHIQSYHPGWVFRQPYVEMVMFGVGSILIKKLA